MRAILKDRLQAVILLNKWLEIEKEYEIKDDEILLKTIPEKIIED